MGEPERLRRTPCGRLGDCEDQDCSMTIDAGTYEYCCVCGEDVDSCICFSDHDDYDYDERMTDE